MSSDFRMGENVCGSKVTLTSFPAMSQGRSPKGGQKHSRAILIVLTC